jgi:hypothetical protein
MPKQPWKPWHEVVSLREDLRAGELPLQMFAADLYEVLMQRGKQPVYEDPASFFALTYPTYTLRQLVRDVMHRVARKNDKAVRQLELTYGGGKTHTLITLRHLAGKPSALPNLPAVDEFKEAVEGKLAQARVVGLCFDKLDVEKGMEIISPDGKKRMLREPWSVLAYQIAGDDGLRMLHAKNEPEERESAPAENLLTELLEIPTKEGLGVLILIDEVLMYAREKAAADPASRSRILNFFQYLTQAATKVDRCCVVASLLASDPSKEDSFGRQLKGDLYDIFQRQREEAVEPVVKADVAELLRRRFFTTESIRDKDAFKPHVQAAIKGIAGIDESTRRDGRDAEERYFKSYPFHPDLTDVFYTKWTSLDRFQRARGVLRTFALALRGAETWDDSPLVTAAALLNAPGEDDLSEAMRELVNVADTEEHEGKRQSWGAIVEGELRRARDIQRDAARLNSREVEQAVIATFLHSQPVGRTAQTRDLKVLLGATRPDPIELEKGLRRWFQMSYWLEDQYAPQDPQQLPAEWKLGHRPNLNQMHAVAVAHFSEDGIKARLLEEIGKTKPLVTGASAAGVRVHVLPQRPRDIEDDGQFHYAVLGPSAASDSGKPSAEARRFLEDTTGPDKPRVYRNAVILLAPSTDGLSFAMARVREHLGWLDVQSELKSQWKDGSLEVARMSTLSMNVDTSRNRIADAIRQAWSTVVTISRQNDVQAFKINVTDDPHFITIKNDERSRIQESAITAEALLPGGPYDLWKSGETSRRVRDLTSAFASHPHLPKMLKAQAIHQTLVEGCEQGTFVLKLSRPDASFRTWWRSRVDEVALNDPAVELILPEAAELTEIPYTLLIPGALPGLWRGNELTVQNARDYFRGGNVVRISQGGYDEPAFVPKAASDVVDAAIKAAVEAGLIWMLNGPASILGEPVPHGVLTKTATLQLPPPEIAATEILSQTLPAAWEGDTASALSIATALSQQFGQTLPWKTVRDVLDNAIRARFVDLDPTSGTWPAEFASARTIKLKPSSVKAPTGSAVTPERKPNTLFAEAELAPREMQDFGDVVPKLLEIKAKHNFNMRFRLQIEVEGNPETSVDVKRQLNQVLKSVTNDFEMS